MNGWKYKDQLYDKTPEDYESFVYIIKDSETKKYYIGKKNFWRTDKLRPLKGRINKRHRIKESDWMTYQGSCQELLDDIQKYGEDRFEREILILCKKRSIASYFELYLQLDSGVLFDDNSYNNIINVRLNGNIFKSNIEECKRILEDLRKRV